MTPPDVSDDVTRSESDRARRTVRSPQNRPDRARNRSVGIILTGLIVAVSMSSIDQTIVSLSSQTIQTGLSLDSRGIEWIVNSYLLAAAALFPVAGKLADVLGYKRMMLAGTIAFAIGSFCAGSPRRVLSRWRG
jgi:MFS family permease